MFRPLKMANVGEASSINQASLLHLSVELVALC